MVAPEQCAVDPVDSVVSFLENTAIVGGIALLVLWVGSAFLGGDDGDDGMSEHDYM